MAPSVGGEGVGVAGGGEIGQNYFWCRRGYLEGAPTLAALLLQEQQKCVPPVFLGLPGS